MSTEHLYLVTYDISNPKRLRRIFRILEGYGEWVQLSVFQCRMSQRRRQRLIAEIEAEIRHNEDHVLIFRLGRADSETTDYVSLGRSFKPLEREPLVV
jgi:CRISPR-associated protein Cas2